MNVIFNAWLGVFFLSFYTTNIVSSGTVSHISSSSRHMCIMKLRNKVVYFCIVGITVTFIWYSLLTWKALWKHKSKPSVILEEMTWAATNGMKTFEVGHIGRSKVAQIENPVRSKTRIDLFLAVVTAPKRIDRRMAVRETWLSTLPNYPGIVMRFFTDGIGLEDGVMSDLTKERETFGDLEFLPLKGGFFLTHRILWSLFWAYEHYDFHFFLKTDDDYFICLNHLHYDIQLRKQEKYLSWGWMHCDTNRKLVWIDEGMLILSKDLVDEIIARNNSLVCHPQGDQALAMWLNDIEKEGKNITYFADNGRLIHSLGDLNGNDKNEDLCSTFIGIHQAYPKYMREYWRLSSNTWHNVTFPTVARKSFHEYCPGVPKGSFDWRSFPDEWRHEPKPCWFKNSSWSYLDKMKIYIGREGT